MSPGGNQSIFIRRKVGEPTDYMHTKSRKVKKQREVFGQASTHYSHLTSSQKQDLKRQVEEVEYIRDHGKTYIKVLQGRQLFISKDIHSISETQAPLQIPFDVCIILTDQERNPLDGELFLLYLIDGEWHQAPKIQIALGNWLFPLVPPGQQSYRVYGQAEYFLDPHLPQHQYMTEAALRAHHYHQLIYAGDYLTDLFLPTVDGQVYHDAGFNEGQGLPWEELVASPGNFAYPTLPYCHPCQIIENRFDYLKWRCIVRSIFMFNTSRLPDDCTKIMATLSLYGYAKRDRIGIAPDVNIYSANPASDITLVPGDYATIGSIPYCDTPITYSNWQITHPYWNTFYLNDTGLAAISKTGLTKIATRNANYDVSGIAPQWSSTEQHAYLRARCSEYGIPQSPRLTVFYTVPEPDPD